MPTQLDDRQVVNRAALAAIGTSVNASLDTVFTAINTLFANATSAPTASVIMKRDASSNTQVNNLIPNFTSTATAAGTTTLVVGSSYYQQFTGSTTQTVVLPNATTLIVGQTFAILNRSTGYVTVNKNGGTLQSTLAPGAQALITVTNIGSAAGTWDTSTSTTGPIPFLQTSVITDSTTTGANATLTAADILNGVVRLTNASLTSVGGIPAGGSGQFLIIENKTGASVTINDEDTVVTAANRILTGLSGPVTMLNDSTFAFTYDTTSSRWMLTGGSGSGSGTNSGINYILNPSATVSAAGWTAYADAAGAIPVDGQGGSPTITFGRSTTSPVLRGLANFRLVKTAANSQGQGASYDFTIDRADSIAVGTGPKQLQITLDYEIISGTYGYGTSSTLSDLSVWIYDRVNSVLIPCSGYKFDGGPVQCTFQPNSNSDSYRLIFHIGTTTATAWTMTMTNIQVGPQVTTSGPAMSDWVAYTPTITTGSGSLTNATTTGMWRRDGDNLEVRGQIIFSAASAVFAGIRVPLPSGLSIDTTKVLGTQVGGATFGTVNVLDNGTSNYPSGQAVYFTTTVVELTIGAITTHTGTAPVINPGIGNTFPITFGASDLITWNFTVPIVGWSSNTLISDSASNRLVLFKGNKTGAQALTGGVTDLTLSTLKDTHGAYNGTSFRVPVPGNYRVSGFLYATTGSNSAFQIYVNGVGSSYLLASTLNFGGAGSCVISDLKVGDLITVRAVQTCTTASDASQSVEISLLQGPSQIAASEIIAARYRISANRSPSANTSIDYDTKIFDTHGLVTGSGTTWRFTAQSPGYYHVDLVSLVTVAVAATNYIYKNGSIEVALCTTNTTNVVGGSGMVFLNTGEYIYIGNDGSPTYNSTSSGALNQVSIHRIGGIM